MRSNFMGDIGSVVSANLRTALMIIFTQPAKFMSVFRRQKFGREHMKMSVAVAIMLSWTATMSFIMIFSGTFTVFFTYSMAGSLALMKFRNRDVFKIIWLSNFLNIGDGSIKEVIC